MEALKLVGNTTRDRIYAGSTLVAERRGGIQNIARELRVPFKVYSTELSDATIHLGASGQKTSIVDWEEENFLGVEFEPSQWTHVAYLDCVQVDVGSLRSPSISVDLCKPSYSGAELLHVLYQLSKVEILLISESELHALCWGLDDLVRRTNCTVILRTRDRVLVTFGRDRLEYPNKWIDVLDTVGAGDAFVAEFLNNVVESPSWDFDQVIPKCVDKAVEYLRRLNGSL